MRRSLFPSGYDPKIIFSHKECPIAWALPGKDMWVFYETITVRCFNVLATNADSKGDRKLSQYIEKNFDDLVNEWTPIIRNLINTYFSAPMHGEAVEWVDPWDFIYALLPWSEIEKEEIEE